ncbi:MAG: hypothetical protein ACFFAO_01545 [Candidatus Hermodarchaeota archaeon]
MKRNFTKFIVFIIIITGIFFTSCIYSISLTSSSNTKENIINSDNTLKTSDDIFDFTDGSEELDLPDKVYTFLAPAYTITFELYLEGEYMYYIYFELVTPHNVSSMKVTLWDNEGRKFELFERAMYYDPESSRWDELPFGTAESGEYNISFSMQADDNFNLYIRMTQVEKCLFDDIDIKSPVLFKVSPFPPGGFYEDSVYLKTDYMYKFYIKRVSPISDQISEEVRINFILTDPDDNNFTIYDYNDDILADINGYNSFEFGTAIGGFYEFEMQIYLQNVDYVNIAFAVDEEYQISQIQDVNETDSSSSGDSKSSKLKLDDDNISIPQEWLLGSVLFVGGVIGSAFVVLKRYRKESYVGLPLNPK